ncbi:hypothetical protein GJ744_011853 [Endocarpon pusillum]|uniref:Uncharacterized protein n=1 Tax=Endocarpon pusillum TaxID=364733 RepID=A0A8H7AEL4_9EURO|nr:hypothetical protein GJ744_011853 [Endocarpon pusillum]
MMTGVSWALGLPAKYGFALRSNPLLCASDALTVLTSTLYWSIQLRSLLGGARKVARRRFEEPEDEEGPPRRESGRSSSSLQELQRNKIFRTCVFVFGALPQTVKLYAMSGIFWTKVLGSMFVGSFVILEVIVGYLAGGLEDLPRDETANTDGGRIRPFELLAQAACLTFSFYYLGLGLYEAVENITGPPSLLNLTIYGVFVTLANLCTMAAVKRRGLVQSWALYGSIGVALVCMSSFRTYSVLVPLDTYLRPELDGSVIYKVLYFLTISASVHWALVATIQGYRELHLFQLTRRVHYIDISLGIFFICVNLASALTFYAYKFNPRDRETLPSAIRCLIRGTLSVVRKYAT